VQGERCDAERGGDGADAGNFRSLDARAQTFRDGERALGPGLREDDCELLAAVARGRVHAANLFAQLAREYAQRSVARVVAVRVVDALEVVYVDEYERDGLAHAGRKMKVALKLNLEEAAVEAARQPVGQCLLLHLLEEARVVDGDGHLVGHRAHEHYLVVLPDAHRVVRRDHQHAHRALVEDDGHGRDRSRVRADRASAAVVNVRLHAPAQPDAVGFDVAEQFVARCVVRLAVAEVAGGERRLAVLALDAQSAVLRAERASNFVDGRL